MRNVVFDPATLSSSELAEWEKLLARAKTATDRVIVEWEAWLTSWLAATTPQRETMKFKPELNANIWGDLKDWMFRNLFYKNCAYCETNTVRFYGDAEHHRPKGRVQTYDANGGFTFARCQVEVAGSNEEMTHPGYFWLAYDWRNLVPSCEVCNSGAGKVDKYPAQHKHILMKKLSTEEVAALVHPATASKTWPGYYYLGPADLDLLENPLLLSPLNPRCDRSPTRHLCFGVCGIIQPLNSSGIGESTIKILLLDDDDLVKKRCSAQESIQREFFSKLANSHDPKQEADRVRAPYLAGEKPYSVPALQFLEVVVRQIG